MTLDQAMQAAISHHQSGQLSEAEKIYRQVLAAQPNHIEALHLLGVLAGQAGQREVAVDLIGRAIALNPRHLEALSDQAYFLIELGRLREAVAACNRTIEIAPNHAGSYNNLGNALGKLQRYEEAIAACKRAIAIDPRQAGAYTNLGNALLKVARLQEAIAAFDQALTLDPDSATTHNNRGFALCTAGQREQAVAAYRRAIELDPNLAMAYNNLGKELRGLRQFDESLAAFRKALQLKPAEHVIHWNYALALLSLGHFSEGWEEFEWGVKAAWQISGRHFTAPAWNGQDLCDRTLFLHDEGGFGDALQFVRYVTPLKTFGARLILQCKPALVPLFAELPCVDAVIAEGRTLPSYDFHASLQGLPRLFKTDLTNIPNRVPYLKAPIDYLERWRPRMRGDRPKVGLVWSGVSHHEVPNASRIHGQEFLASIAQVGGIQFFSLQKGGESKIPRPAGLAMIELGDDLHDFADTAAVIELLDLVISVDTAAAHLAGALAKPIWMLIPDHADFHYRWLLDRTDSPWYPTMRIFRQSRPGDVAGTLNRVVAALREWCR
jgi:tetratricopeptide (TPR) repeat protein